MNAIPTEIASTTGQPYPIKISRVHPNPDQPRRYFNQEKLVAMSYSIEEDKQQQPISVERHPDKPGEFIILDGERRWRSIKLIWERTGKEPTIDAFITIVKDRKELYRRSVIANLHREDFSDLDEAAALSTLQEDGTTVEKLAAMVNKSTSYVNNRIRMHRVLSDKVKAMLSPELPKEQRLSITTAVDIALSTRDHATQIDLATEAVSRGLNVESTRMLIDVKMPRTNHGYVPAAVTNPNRVPAAVPRTRAEAKGVTQQVADANTWKQLNTFLGATSSRVIKLLDEDLEGMFFSRDDEKGDRDLVDRRIGNIIVDLRRLQAKARSSS